MTSNAPVLHTDAAAAADDKAETLFNDYEKFDLDEGSLAYERGRILNELEDSLKIGSGKYGNWTAAIQKKLRLKPKTAKRYQRYMKGIDDVAEKTGKSKDDIMSLLLPTAGDIVFAPKLPGVVLDEVIGKLEAGEKITVEDAKGIAGRHKDETKPDGGKKRVTRFQKDFADFNEEQRKVHYVWIRKLEDFQSWQKEKGVEIVPLGNESGGKLKAA